MLGRCSFLSNVLSTFITLVRSCVFSMKLNNFLFSTNSIVGRVYSKVFDEQVVCMDMGPVGCCMCVAMIPLGIYTPSGGMGIYCCLSNYLRGEVARKYRLREEPLSKNGCLNFCLLGVCYPCSFFQMLSTIRYYEAKNRYQI